ncbi:hypothetical protein, partial [Thiolapillus sp.]|uniref:hypothetical protein n=1 Tax=Thiolapillus sp. TaxID=2017437 RepID=UPI003AF84101
MIDFGTSQSPKSTRPLTTYSCPSRPGHQALHNNFASSLLLRTCLPMTGRRVRMPTSLRSPWLAANVVSRQHICLVMIKFLYTDQLILS